jgi:hypothetical protein
MAMIRDTAEYGGYPPEYYNYGPSAPHSQKQPVAGYENAGKAWSIPYNPTQGGILSALGGAAQQLAQRDPGVTSALEALEQIVASLSKLSYDLENTLGLSNPEPCDSVDKNPHVPSLVSRLQNLGNQIDSANYRINKSVTHLKS